MKKINKKEMVNKELEKLVNMSRMLTETEVTNKLIDIIIKYQLGGVLHNFENGLLKIDAVDYL